MDDVTHIINGMDIEGVLNGGESPVVVDGIFTGEIHAATVTLTEYALFSGKLSATYVEIGGQFLVGQDELDELVRDGRTKSKSFEFDALSKFYFLFGCDQINFSDFL